MPALVAGIHVLQLGKMGVDARDKPAHDESRRRLLSAAASVKCRARCFRFTMTSAAPPTRNERARPACALTVYPPADRFARAFPATNRKR
jgi:hypothetical protein